MILDDKLLDEVTARAKTSERLRMNFNLHDSLDAKAQRLLNALEPGTVLPVHRHPHTDETYVILRGRFDVIFCDEHGRQTQRFALDPLKGVYGIHVPKGQWHTLEVLESGTVLFRSRTVPMRRWRRRTWCDDAGCRTTVRPRAGDAAQPYGRRIAVRGDRRGAVA